MKKKDSKWIAYREGEAVGIFKDRKEAVKWFKGLLQQTLKDFDKQDKTDEFNYNIEIKRIVIEPLVEREGYLGL